MTSPITGISSMATKAMLARLAADYEAHAGRAVHIESVGGVDAAKRVAAGERFDTVVLARDAIDALLSEGHVRAGSDVNVARSGVAVAVRAGAVRRNVGTEEDLVRAILAARTVGISTGPSGVRLERQFARWGIGDLVGPRIIKASPGVPVGSLVARGDVELGFQQLSELVHVDGLCVLGLLPEPVQIVTTFTAAVVTHSRQPEAAQALLEFLASPSAADAKRREGMEPA